MYIVVATTSVSTEAKYSRQRGRHLICIWNKGTRLSYSNVSLSPNSLLFYKNGTRSKSNTKTHPSLHHEVHHLRHRISHNPHHQHRCARRSHIPLRRSLSHILQRHLPRCSYPTAQHLHAPNPSPPTTSHTALLISIPQAGVLYREDSCDSLLALSCCFCCCCFLICPCSSLQPCKDMGILEKMVADNFCQVPSNPQEPDWHCFASLPHGSATDVHAKNIAMIGKG
jgi:hypothetical protein